ncbi:hypothetical protein ACFLXQ_08045 [Chloroflexota bacterium]
MSHQDDLRKLIRNNQRRLQKLKEQQALEGLSTEPRLLIEIEDIETEIAKLQAELAQPVSPSENIEVSVPATQQIPPKKAASKSTVQAPVWSVIVGSIMIVAVLGWLGWLILFRDTTPSASTSAGSLTPLNTLTPESVGLVSPESSCVDQYLADIGEDKQISLEEGVRAGDLFISTQELTNNNQSGLLGVRLTQNGEIIAALKFIFFPENTLFKITSVIGADCQEVEEYSNASRPAGNALENWDVLEIQLPQGLFTVRFGWQGDHVRFNFGQVQ